MKDQRMGSMIEELCEAVLEARAARDKIKEELEHCGDALAAAEEKLKVALQDNKVSHGGFTFSMSEKVSWKTPKENKVALLELLKEGVPELVKESVNASTLNAYLRKNEETLESDTPSWWSKAKKFVERTETKSLSVRKTPTK